jgi:hypothetical protein
MVAVLGDGIVFKCTPNNGNSNGNDSNDSTGQDKMQTLNRSVSASYMEELPISYFNEEHAGKPRLIWHFGYEQQRQSLHDSRRKGTLFQVHIWWHAGNCNSCSDSGAGSGHSTISDGGCDATHTASFKEVLRIGEDLNTHWGAYETRRRVGEWVYSKVAELRQEALPPTAADVAAETVAAAEQADRVTAAEEKKVAASTLLGQVNGRRKQYVAVCLKSPEPPAACDEAKAALDASHATAIQLLQESKLPPPPPPPPQKPRVQADVSTLLPPGVHAGHGEIPDGDVWAAEMAKCSASVAFVQVTGAVDDSTGDDGTGGVYRKRALCAVQLGRKWVGGRVEMNVLNKANVSVGLWHGT